MLSLSTSPQHCAGQVSSYYKRKKGKAEPAPEGHGRRTWISAAFREKPSGYGTSGNRTKLLPVSGRSTNLNDPDTIAMGAWGSFKKVNASDWALGTEHDECNLLVTYTYHTDQCPSWRCELQSAWMNIPMSTAL